MLLVHNFLVDMIRAKGALLARPTPTEEVAMPFTCRTDCALNVTFGGVPILRVACWTNQSLTNYKACSLYHKLPEDLQAYVSHPECKMTSLFDGWAKTSPLDVPNCIYLIDQR